MNVFKKINIKNLKTQKENVYQNFGIVRVFYEIITFLGKKNKKIKTDKIFYQAIKYLAKN